MQRNTHTVVLVDFYDPYLKRGVENLLVAFCHLVQFAQYSLVDALSGARILLTFLLLMLELIDNFRRCRRDQI